MRKHFITRHPEKTSNPEQPWLDVEDFADVEITSEDPAYPVESALLPNRSSGWRAGTPGKQTLRLRFAQPQQLRRIWLNFVEFNAERTQEYVLRWSPDGQSFHDIVRQQWNFSPQGATSETDDHHVELPAVAVLELNIVPDISGGNALASLTQLRLA